MFRFMRRAAPEMQLIYKILLVLFTVTFLANFLIALRFWLTQEPLAVAQTTLIVPNSEYSAACMRWLGEGRCPRV